jgi:XTP/dITP diphosphohydrolase
MLINPEKIVLASHNLGKINEFKAMLVDYSIIPQSEFNLDAVDETGTTFVENAILKARHASFYSHLPAIADDSGLMVDALNGAPGIISARYAGINASDQESCVKLLSALKGFVNKPLTARFVCVLVLMQNAEDSCPLIAQGLWEGEITLTPKGENGFGYDSVFFIKQHQCTSAQLSSEQKNKLSHRGKALRSLRLQMKSGHSI